MTERSIKDLIEAHNALVGDDQKITTWKKSAKDLAQKIEDIEREERKRASHTIKDLAQDLLLAVDYEQNGRRVGLPYEEILKRIKRSFPEADTTDKCLRWYAVHLNREPDVRMPFRPRRRTQKKKAA